jgi:acyl carrier protein phosphodiesterase
MNFLAHLHLSGDEPLILVGNFIGDFVKGRNLYERFDREVARGIELHRSIDEFTDHHPVVSESKERLRAKYRHYAGVIVDVFYDHFLARHWNDFHDRPLHDFASQCYSILSDHHELLPADVKQMLPYMISGNWLVGYAAKEGIRQALRGMARRTTFESGMENAADDLNRHYESFDLEFLSFFPDLRKHCHEFLV